MAMRQSLILLQWLNYSRAGQTREGIHERELKQTENGS